MEPTRFRGDIDSHRSVTSKGINEKVVAQFRCLPTPSDGVFLLACGEGPVAVPTSPMVTPVMPADPLRPGAPLMVSRLVVEHSLTGAQPLPGVRLRLRTNWRPPGAFLEATSDGTGHYEVSGIPVGAPLSLHRQASLDIARRALMAMTGSSGTPLSMFMWCQPHCSPRLACRLRCHGHPSGLQGLSLNKHREACVPLLAQRWIPAIDDSDAIVISSTLTDAEGVYLLALRRLE